MFLPPTENYLRTWKIERVFFPPSLYARSALGYEAAWNLWRNLHWPPGRLRVIWKRLQEGLRQIESIEKIQADVATTVPQIQADAQVKMFDALVKTRSSGSGPAWAYSIR